MNRPLPRPLTPADSDLRDFPYMPIDIARLFGSEFHARSDDAAWRAGVTLWLKSFHQVPAAGKDGESSSSVGTKPPARKRAVDDDDFIRKRLKEKFGDRLSPGCTDVKQIRRLIRDFRCDLELDVITAIEDRIGALKPRSKLRTFNASFIAKAALDFRDLRLQAGRSPPGSADERIFISTTDHRWPALQAGYRAKTCGLGQKPKLIGPPRVQNADNRSETGWRFTKQEIDEWAPASRPEAAE